MPLSKFTMIFELSTNADGFSQSTRVGGWTESVYYNGAVSDIRKDFFRTLCTLRAALLPQSAAIVGQRYQNLDPRGGSATGGQRFNGNAAYGNDIPQMALLCSIGAVGATNIRRFELRGLPDELVHQGEYSPDGVYPGLINNFVYALQRDSWYFVGRDLSQPLVPMVSLASGGNFVLSQDLTFDIGNRVQILRTVDADGIQSGGFFYIATKASPRTGNIADWIGGDNVGGKMRLANNVTLLFDRASFAVERVVTRKVGRPFGGYSGRRSVRR